jgi:hypothetical protein
MARRKRIAARAAIKHVRGQNIVMSATGEKQMKKNQQQTDPAAPPGGPTTELSRRQFLHSAAAGMVAAATPLAAMNSSAQADGPSGPLHQAEEILRRYGSELGHIRQIR